MALRDEVLATLNALCEGVGVKVDPDDDIRVDLGSGLMWVRVFDEPATLCVYRPVACDVPRMPAVDEFMHDTNAAYVLFRTFWEDECIVLRVDLPASPFVPRQLQAVLDSFDEIAGQVTPAAQEWSRS